MSDTVLIVITLNAPIDPEDREELFEESLDEMLKMAGWGEIVGGGTALSEGGEIAYADIELEVSSYKPEQLKGLATLLEEIGAPKGSVLTVFRGEAQLEELEFGKLEGLAVYLNGVDLPAETYKRYSLADAWDALDNELGEDGMVFSSWTGPNETALYLYGERAEKMLTNIKHLFERHPLFKQGRHEVRPTDSVFSR